MTYTRFSLAVASLFLFVLSTMPAQAQSPWSSTFGHQIAELLHSPDAALQGEAMRVFIEVADRQDQNVNLRPAAKALLDVYTTSPHSSHRLMAVVALSKIDDGSSYTTLLKAALNEMDEQTRRTILHAAAGSRSITSALVASAFNELLKQSLL